MFGFSSLNVSTSQQWHGILPWSWFESEKKKFCSTDWAELCGRIRRALCKKMITINEWMARVCSENISKRFFPAVSSSESRVWPCSKSIIRFFSISASFPCLFFELYFALRFLDRRGKKPKSRRWRMASLLVCPNLQKCRKHPSMRKLLASESELQVGPITERIFLRWFKALAQDFN